ncbi:hypothetical protein OG762_08575 [Streptomyces sp. NBC_01136]|uniref:hypothetical protein n=1 Tax=unclassified Streptomyces TaxID=2593676 RepID=UPI003243E00B|nr:hypothetical protein OG762_08575 [Streptomyces sp. NBC_01136]
MTRHHLVNTCNQLPVLSITTGPATGLLTGCGSETGGQVRRVRLQDIVAEELPDLQI